MRPFETDHFRLDHYRINGKEWSSYVVIHKPTALKVGMPLRRRDAVAFAKQLEAAADVDWTQADQQYFADLPDGMRSSLRSPWNLYYVGKRVHHVG